MIDFLYLCKPLPTVAVMGALAAYQILVLAERDDKGILVGILIGLPVLCIGAGVAWWILRLLGLWPVR